MARELVGIDFPTQDAMDKYLKEHPDADKTNHRVVETKKPSEKSRKIHLKHMTLDNPLYPRVTRRFMLPGYRPHRAARNKIACRLLFMARELVGIDFPTQDAMDKYLKEHPDADKTNHRVVETKKDAPAKKPSEKSRKIHPKHMTLDKKEHTHSFGKLKDGDDDETKVRVYDNGGKTADRYSVVVEGKDWESSVNPGMVPVLGLSESPSHPQGVSQWGEGKEGSHLGKPVKWDSLNIDLKKHIMQRLNDSGE